MNRHKSITLRTLVIICFLFVHYNLLCSQNNTSVQNLKEQLITEEHNHIDSTYFHEASQQILVEPRSESVISFRHGSETLYRSLANNQVALSTLKSVISQNHTQLVAKESHIQLTALIPVEQCSNLVALNLASIRASVVRMYLKETYPYLSDFHFTFFIEPTNQDNAIRVDLVPSSIVDSKQSEIWYTLSKNYPEKIEYAMSHYTSIPFLDGYKLFEAAGMDFNATDPILDNTPTSRLVGMAEQKTPISIFYRWDKYNLDEEYLTNAETLVLIDSLLTNENSRHIDSLVVVAYASPEGRVAHNQVLSERRAETIKQYILNNYPSYNAQQIVTIPRGENWDGFRRMAVADPHLPMKEQVLNIIDSTKISDSKKQSLIAQLDGGAVYRNYILPNYYRYLRLGASLFIKYLPAQRIEIDFEPIAVNLIEPVFSPFIFTTDTVVAKDTVYNYPIALRSNLLYDAVGALNIGVEIPYGKKRNWSFIADIAYSYWQSPRNLYALQTLEYGIENRYWFGVSENRKSTKRYWDQPLKGFYVGGYGKYWQRYDVQWIDGVQGDASWSAGITAGYAIPLNRSLSFDFGLGGGWVSTSEYRHYHQPEYDANGKYHLMWQQTGKWSGLSLTKVRFALVWLIQTKKIQEKNTKK